jgi:hypothetical protein
MFQRLPAILIPAVLLLIFPLPVRGASHGPIVRGRVIDQSMTVDDTTGVCSCEVKWFTIGLAPGVVRVAAELKSSSFSRGPTYGMSVLFMQGTSTLTWGKVACQVTRLQCYKWVRLSHRITRRGVYYVEVIGLGAEIIPYALQIQGAIYRLHCHKYC